MKINKKVMPNPASSQVQHTPVFELAHADERSLLQQSSGQAHKVEGNPVGDAT
jgi:hypothetical protein